MKRPVRIGYVIVLVLVIAFVLTGFVEGRAFIRIFVGWVNFIGTVIPGISIDIAGVATFIICLGLAAILGQSFCRWLWKNSGHEEPWKPRWTAAGLAVVVLMFAAGMAFTGVVHQTGWLLRSPDSMFVSTPMHRSPLCRHSGRN